MERIEQKEWISTQEAAAILTANSNHAVSDAYVRWLASHGKLETQQIDRRTRLYKRSAVEGYTVKAKRKRKPKINGATPQ